MPLGIPSLCAASMKSMHDKGARRRADRDSCVISQERHAQDSAFDRRLWRVFDWPDRERFGAQHQGCGSLKTSIRTGPPFPALDDKPRPHVLAPNRAFDKVRFAYEIGHEPIHGVVVD